MTDVASIIAGAAQAHGQDPTVPLRIGQIESSLNPAAHNAGSGADGLFQFVPSTAKAYGLANPQDPAASADAAARLLRDNRATLTKYLGRDPTGRRALPRPPAGRRRRREAAGEPRRAGLFDRRDEGRAAERRQPGHDVARLHRHVDVEIREREACGRAIDRDALHGRPGANAGSAATRTGGEPSGDDGGAASDRRRGAARCCGSARRRSRMAEQPWARQGLDHWSRRARRALRIADRLSGPVEA